MFVYQEKLVAIVLGMLRQHKYNFIDVYREESSTTLKAIVKQVSFTICVCVQVQVKLVSFTICVYKYKLNWWALQYVCTSTS